ncbi:MAG: MFS transporter [Simkaniaceae bacterium]|nr:MFS transporter [Simkaniaceae bacterium]MCF7852208.1 MFS transporter [Simkaniaceae bacterium]
MNRLLSNEPSQSSFFFRFCLLVTLFLAIFYNTVTNMAGVYIVSEMGGSNEISVYPMVFFGLGNALAIPLSPSLSQRWGPIHTLVYCLLLYTLSSILCAMAPTFPLFNLFRFMLGLTSGPFYILVRELILRFTPEKQHPAYAFVMVLLFAIVPVFGACFGAWLGYENHWRWIFHTNEPIALFLAGYFWIVYRKTDTKESALKPFDRIGYFFFFIGLGSLIMAATLSQELDWTRSTLFNVLVVIGVPSLLFFILWELIHPEPLLNLRLLKSPLLSYSLLNLGVLFASYFGMIILIALWLNIYANYTPLWVSVLIGTMALAGLFAFFIMKTFLEKFDPRFTLALSILFFATSCYYSTFFDVDVDFFHLSVARALAGFGLILFLFPVFRMSMASYGPEQSSEIFKLFQTTRSTFSSLGAGLYVILWQRRQVFFHERLGEGLTINSQLTLNYFQRAKQIFSLSKDQSNEELNNLLTKHATSLALNDVFGFMGYLLMALLILLILTFVIEKIVVQRRFMKP